MCASASHSNRGGFLTPSREVLIQTCPDLPPIVSAATAIQRLRTIRFIPARQAMAQLAVWQDASRILQLYRRYFSQEFARSTTSTAVPIYGGEPGHSERELEFFRLVDQRLFPLPEVMYDMERLPSIPLYPQGIDWEDERENLRVSLRAAMALVSDDDSMLWEAWLPANLRPTSGERNWELFDELCRRSRGLAVRFPLLLEFVGLDTGNPWLDSNWECCWENYPWEEAAMEYLRKEWRKAQHIFAQLNPLLDRIDQHPRYWLMRLVKLWNSAIKTQTHNAAIAM